MERWLWAGERALLRRFDGELLEANAAVHGLCASLASLAPGEIDDVVAGARSVLVQLRSDEDPSEILRDVLERGDGATLSPERAPIEIAVTYGGEQGPDLTDVARINGLDERDVIRAHTEPTYTVAFIGFSPGFPYLIGLPDAIATPRLDTPRTRIPAGSVGIGGPYSGVYPRATPGGWRIIGRTHIELFDPDRTPPALLAPGDRVRFVPA